MVCRFFCVLFPLCWVFVTNLVVQSHEFFKKNLIKKSNRQCLYHIASNFSRVSCFLFYHSTAEKQIFNTEMFEGRWGHMKFFRFEMITS